MQVIALELRRNRISWVIDRLKYWTCGTRLPQKCTCVLEGYLYFSSSSQYCRDGYTILTAYHLIRPSVRYSDLITAIAVSCWSFPRELRRRRLHSARNSLPPHNWSILATELTHQTQG